jgi:hypothetical protein
MKKCDLTKIKSKLSLASLLLTAGLFSKTAQAAACPSGRLISDIKNASFSTLVECAVPSAARTAAISPYGIIVLVINFISGIAIALSVLGIVLGLLWIATSAGDKTKYQNATGTLKNSVIALIVIILANRILTLLLSQFGF